MIKKADVIERLSTLIGKELSTENLHDALFCEVKHQKILRRFHAGTHTYVQYNIQKESKETIQHFADITIPGNPTIFRVALEEKAGKMVIQSEPRINFSYIIR